MKVFRIEREKYLSSTLKGIGASMTPGYRWNSLKTSIVYASESRALAILEVSAHLDIGEDLPVDRHCVEIEIPTDIEIQEVMLADLPELWDSKPPIMATQFIGDDFVYDQITAVLRVPSCIVPQEYNYLINPNHPDVKRIKVISISKLSFDRRIYKK